MAKLTKGKLKEIIKECLVEILTEGISPASPAGQSLMEAASRPRAPRRQADEQRPAPDSDRFDNAVNHKIDSLTQDPMLASIFADTARTTLQEQTHAEGRRTPSAASMGDAAARAVEENALEDMFGEGTQNWAAIAFSDAVPK
jgi:hypothetical protein